MLPGFDAALLARQFKAMVFRALGGDAAAARQTLGALGVNDPLPWANVTGEPTTKSGYGITDMPTYSDLLAESNLVTNPAFAINQRAYVSGTATGSANQVTLDRWRVVTSGQALTFAASGAGNIATAPAGGIEQVIRGANVRGGTYTISWTGTATCTVNGVAATTGSQVTLPANTNVSLKFASGTVSEVMLTPGSSAGTFVLRSYVEELARCQVEYWALGHSINLQGYAASGGDKTFMNIQFPVQMGAVPTITNSWSAGTNIAVNTIQTSGTDGFVLVIQASGVGQFANIYVSGNSASTGI